MRLKYLLNNTTSIRRTEIVRICYFSSFYRSYLSYLITSDRSTFKRKFINHTSLMKLSTTSAPGEFTDLNDESTYHKVADRTLEQIMDFLSHLDDINDDVDVNLSQGVLSISLSMGDNSGTNMTWVINKQTPNRQLWWSSPISGPRRYEWQPDKAIHSINSNHDRENLLISWKYNRTTTTTTATTISSPLTTTTTTINTLQNQLYQEILQVTGVDLLNIE